MHACFQTGCHDSIGLNSAWEDSGFVLGRKVEDCREHFGLETTRSGHPQWIRRTTNSQCGRGPTNVLWAVFICLLHPIRHARIQTIN